MTRYFTGKPCKRGHIAERLISNRACVDCLNANTRKYYANNPEKYIERTLNWYFKEHEKHKETKREYMKKNKDHYNVLRNHRKRGKTNRTPKWLTSEMKNQIVNIYNEAQRLTKLTGIEFHVDHVIPLHGEEVSGLHVPWNLQLLTREENIAKGNRVKYYARIQRHTLQTCN